VSEPARARWLFLALALSGLAACALPEFLTPRPGADAVEHWTRETEELRGLEFRAPVEVEWIRSSDIPAITRAEMLAELPPGYVESYRDAYAALGVLPPDIDLVATLTELQEDQLVGLYSTRVRVMYVVGNSQDPTGYEDTTILVHELVHALQHQHFSHTVALLQGLRHNDDVVSAISAVMEGDASLTMLGTSSRLERNLENARELSDAMVVDLDNPTGVMASVPRFLSASLIFPYAYGILTAAERWDAQGNAGLDGLMRDPPLSSARVLFPRDDDPVEFVRFPAEALAAHAAALGCEIGSDNVAGALTLRVLFEDHGDAEDLAPMLRAWSGDRFVHLDCGETSELLWLTRWDDAEGAAEFARRYAAIAPRVAQVSDLSGTPRVRLDGRSALVTSGGLHPLGEVLLREAEVRAYASTSEWVRDACFPESPCPVDRSPAQPSTVAGEDRASRR
jgi:hypothetical protein